MLSGSQVSQKYGIVASYLAFVQAECRIDSNVLVSSLFTYS
jgi:hypothetical protein